MLRTLDAAEPHRRQGQPVQDWYETAEKPVGGFSRVTVHQILLIWWARLSGLIGAFEFRLWWAAVEVKARREAAAKSRDRYSGAVPNRFNRFAEWSGLIGGGAGIEKTRRGFKRLKRLGLLTCTASEIHFIESPDELRCEDLSDYWALLNRVGNAARRNQPVPVPRSMVRLLAGGVGRGVAATMLGVLLRCLRRRRLSGAWMCVSGGLVSASWIADVFGVGEATVKHAFGHLQGLGWLDRLDTPHWVQQQHGARTVVNLTWSRPADEPEAAGGLESTPPAAENRPVSTPPLQPTGNSLRDKETKNPARPDQSGFSSAKGTEEPTLRHVVPEDLRSTERLLVLLGQARKAGMVGGTEYERLQFATAAEHALVKGTKNACGLFVHLVRNKLWHFCTNDDEDAAQRRLKRYFYGDVAKRSLEPALERPKPAPIVLSEDARLVRAVVQVATKHRIAEPFYLLKREKPEWTRERWEKAEGEIESARLLQFHLNAGVSADRESARLSGLAGV